MMTQRSVRFSLQNRYRFTEPDQNRLMADVDYKYLMLAERLEQGIVSGLYRPNDKLPSVRTLRREFGLSVSTILEAYRYLDDKGLVRVAEKSGYFVCPPRSVRQPIGPTAFGDTLPLQVQSVQVFDIIRRLYEESSGLGGTSFDVAVPGDHLLPVSRLKTLMNRTVNEESRRIFGYGAIRGLAELRQEIAKRSLRAGIQVQPDEICITAGCVEAIQLALRAVTQPGDVVAVESPCYYGFLEILEVLNLKIVEIPASPTDGIDLPQLATALQTYPIKAVLLCANFSNPTGAVMPDPNKAALLRLAAQYQVPLIEDDIYGDLFFGTHRPLAAKAFDTDGWCIYCSSFSKTLAPGYRIGWVVGGRFQAQIERLKYITNMTSPTHQQLVIARFLQSGAYERYLKTLRQQTGLQQRTVQEAIARFFPANTRLTTPLGGYVLWVQLPDSIDTMQLYKAAIAQKISFVPGQLFTCTRLYDSYLRLAYGTLNPKTAGQALQTLGRLCQS
jgi:DNA-binding transcriptional MocR family regulator